ncbi:MAG: exosortase/archaeosortase family protein [Victivallaceae bacterium]|jgi:exosortase
MSRNDTTKAIFTGIICLPAALYPFASGIAVSDSEFMVLWLLAAGMLFNAFRGFRKSWNFNPSHMIGWILMVAAVALIWGGILTGNKTAVFFNLSLLALMLSLAAWIAGTAFMLKTLLPFTVFIIILPFLTYCHYLLSYPLCLICAGFTANFLKIFGMNVSNEAAVIVLGGEKISITTACSGIFQLEAMLLLGWLIVVSAHRAIWRRAAHFIMIFPIVIFMNTLRLSAVILLYMNIGNAAFSYKLHTVMGFVMVIIAALLMWFCRLLFKEEDGNENIQK